MANLGNYDATGGQTMGERSALPAGEYVAAMVKSDQSDPNAKGNSYINCEFEVTDGEHKGRRFWSRLNLWNDNAQAVEIAQRELNSICHAVGRLRVNDTEELHGIPMRVKLGVKNDPQYGEQNTIKGYSPLNGGAGQGQHHGGGASFGGGQHSGGGKPWETPRR